MRHITQDGLDLIKRFAGFFRVVLSSRLSHNRLWSRCQRGRGLSAGIDGATGEELLRQDATIAEHAVLRLINVSLADGQFDALVSFTHNLGGGALQRSTLRRKINREEHSEVPEQFMRWVWAGVSSKGWFGGEKRKLDYMSASLNAP